MRTISFITANYVARTLGYNGVSDWAKHDQATIQNTTPERFAEIAREISLAGFENVDIWSGHCNWLHHAAGDYVEQIKGICSQFDLTITSYAGGLNLKTAKDAEAPLRFIKQLGAPLLAGGIWGIPAREAMPTIARACAKFGVQYAFENHPEKSVDEIMEKIARGQYEFIGVALDTGWCGTQGMDALDAAKRLNDKGLLYNVHLKDVTKPGGHETCALGEGVVGVEKVVRYLVESGWNGDMGIEHEPYDRDPMPEVRQSLKRVKEWMK